MFDRIKKAFWKQAKDVGESAVPAVELPSRGRVSEWAGIQGFAFSSEGPDEHLALQGKVGGKPWRMELGHSSRNYIRGKELRGRAELGIHEDVAVLVMNLPLKESLEKKAYSIYTDSLQTMADPNLPEEMRWLAMYDEVGWDSLPRLFWQRYCVLADRRENALAWIDPALAALMLEWPAPAPAAEVPFMLMLLRGKAYLRMEYSPADLPTLQHAVGIFTSACEAASSRLAIDISL